MKKISFVAISFACLAAFSGVHTVSAQGKTPIKPATAKTTNWTGVWSDSSRFMAGSLMIKNQSRGKFRFEIESTNGANSGGISGTAKITGNRAIFDDRLAVSKNAGKYGCILNFTNKGTLIEVKQNRECDSYAGNAVYFAGEYKKGKAKPDTTTLVELDVFPDAKTESAFKKLVGTKSYQRFLDSFQIIYTDEDIDNLQAKVYSACVRGICPYNAGIIMYDENGNFWAAVTDVDDAKKTLIHYYTNAAEWTNKMPKTIEKWTNDKRESSENLEIIYHNRK